MHSFQYQKAKQVEDIFLLPEVRKKYLGGGTSLIDLMKLEVERPELVMDVNHLALNGIEERKDGLFIGAGMKNSDLAYHKEIRTKYKVLSDAILSGASAQLRNKATTAGNLLQRTRCVYFRDTTKACNKRDPGSGCSAIEGHNRNLAVLGTSDSCIATNPSDMNVAMLALEAKINLKSATGERTVDAKDFWVLPGKTPEIETVLQKNEFITGVILPKLPKNTISHYLKLRDRASYEFALASVAVVVSIHGGRIEHFRLAMGGVGTRPWKEEMIDKIFESSTAIPDEQKIAEIGREFFRNAHGYSENSFKIDLGIKCFVQAVTTAIKMAKENT